MRLLCLHFPRLGVQLALRQFPHLEGRSIALVSQTANGRLVSAASAVAAGRGVLAGMRASEAYRRDRACLFLADNVGACLDELERLAAIIRLRATPLVEVGGRDHLFVDLDGGEPQSRGIAAARLLALATAWTGLEARIGAGSTRRAAMAATRASGVESAAEREEDSDGDTPVAPFAAAVVAALVPLSESVTQRVAWSKIERALARLQALLDGRDQGFREAVVRVAGENGDTVLQRKLNTPCFAAADLLDQLGDGLEDGALAGARSVTIELRRLCPDVRIRAWSGPATNSRSSRPRVVRPRQLLLRATG